MKILIRQSGQSKWNLVEAAGYTAETELQALLAESPSLISVSDIRPSAPPLVAAIREVGLPGSGSTDILAFNEQGDIVVVECKLAANQEIKRKVIAQVLEYGAYLWGMTYDELNEKILAREGKNLADLISESAEDPSWDEESFRKTVEENLSRGAFILVIAVDEMNEELNRTMHFLNTCGKPEFSFTVLEMRRFHRDQTDILIPDLHGVISPVQEIKYRSKRKQWTESEFFDVIKRDLSSEVNGIIEDLYRWARQTADSVPFGTGTENGSFTFRYFSDKKIISIFSVYTNGRIQINFSILLGRVGPDLTSSFHQDLIRIGEFYRLPPEINTWPSIKVEEAFLGKPEHLQQFKDLVVDFGRRVKSEIQG